MSQTNRGDLIHCDECGEDYASTYRRCPFCNAKPSRRPRAGAAPVPVPEDLPEDEEVYDEGEPGEYDDSYFDSAPAPVLRGGKRLESGGSYGNARGGGYGRRRGPGRVILGIVIAVAVIALIFFLVFHFAPKLMGLVSSPKPSPSPSAIPSASAAPSVVPSTPAPASEEPTVTPSPEVPVSEPPATQTTPPAVTGLTLSRDDFTLSDRYPTYTLQVTGAQGDVTWSIANEAVATVNAFGRVAAVGNGTTTLTAADASGAKAQCIVRVAGYSGGAAQTAAPSDQPAQSEAPTQAPTQAPAAGASLSTTDFTLSEAFGYTARLTVRGGEAQSWASSNEEVATVDADGVVTGHTSGTAKITCTLTDGSTLESIVRVH